MTLLIKLDNGKEVRLTELEAKRLRAELNLLFGETTTPVVPVPYWVDLYWAHFYRIQPQPWWEVQPMITCNT